MARWIAIVFAGACGGGGSRAAPPAEPVPLPPLGAEAGPEGAPAGDKTVRVLDAEPPKGGADGGQIVRLRGANLRTAKGVKVRFGAAAATVLRFTDDEIVVQAPPGSAGQLVDITVIFDSGVEIRLPGAFSYVTSPAGD